MDVSINKISNEQLDKQISESKYVMNSLSISFSYIYAKGLVVLNWGDILIAIDNGFLPHQAAIDHAISQIEKDDAYSQDILDLACLSPSEAAYPHSIQPYVNNLTNLVSEHEKETAKQKMLYLVLKWMFEHRLNYVDPLKAVEIVYADFDYPKEISNFVRYMPMSQPDLGSVQLNEERLFINWNNYLENNKDTFLM